MVGIIIRNCKNTGLKEINFIFTMKGQWTCDKAGGHNKKDTEYS